MVTVKSCVVFVHMECEVGGNHEITIFFEFSHNESFVTKISLSIISFIIKVFLNSPQYLQIQLFSLSCPSTRTYLKVGVGCACATHRRAKEVPRSFVSE